MNNTFIFAGMVIACICIVANAVKEFSEKVDWCIKRERDNLMQGNALLHAHIQAQDNYIKSLKKQLDELKRSIQSKKDSTEEKIRIIESGRLPPVEDHHSGPDLVKISFSTTGKDADIRRLKKWQDDIYNILTRIADAPTGATFAVSQDLMDVKTVDNQTYRLSQNREIQIKFSNKDVFIITDTYIDKFKDLL